MTGKKALFLAGIGVLAFGGVYLFTAGKTTQPPIENPTTLKELNLPINTVEAPSQETQPSTQAFQPTAQQPNKQTQPKKKKRKRIHRREMFLQKWLKMTPAEQEEFLKRHPRAKRPTEEELNAAKAKAENPAAKTAPARP